MSKVEDVLESLIDIERGLNDDTISIKEAGERMHGTNIQRAINFYINKEFIDSNVSMFPEDLEVLREIIKIAQFIYNNSGDTTGLTDSEYDKVYEALVINSGMDLVSSPVPKNTKTAAHTYPELRGSLDKVYYLSRDDEKKNKSRKYLDDWIDAANKTYESLTGEKIDINKEEIYVFPKWDGVSCIMEYDEDNRLIKALTRGDVETNLATDITKMIEYRYTVGPDTTIKKPYGLKTEIMMREDDLDNYNKDYNCDYKNTRSIVSSILNSKELDDRLRYVQAIPLRILPYNGIEEVCDLAFKNYPYTKCRMMDRDLISKFAESHRYIDGFRTDGAVLYIINPKIQKALGRKDNINKFEVAYKFTEESTLSKLKNVTFQVGLFGRVTPVAVIEPVKLKGNTITNISLGSFGRMSKLNLRKGDQVKVMYDIIPYMVIDEDCKRSKSALIKLPKNCPICGSDLEWDENDAVAQCKNKNCPALVGGQIVNYLNKMDIKNISYAIVEKMTKAGLLSSIKDLYSLKIKDIAKLDGMGEPSAINILQEINIHRVVTPYQLLGSIGIDGIGRRIFEKICGEYSIESIIEIAKEKDIDSLTKIPGIGNKVAKSVIAGINEKMNLILTLMNELIIEDDDDNEPKFSVCFTKVRDSDLEEKIKACGGKVVDSLTKDTTYLVVPTIETSSTKIEKAKKDGVTIIPIMDMIELINKMLVKL